MPIHSPETSFSRYFALSVLRGVLVERFDRAHGQRRADAEGHGGGVPHFERGDAEHGRQRLAAILFRPGQRVPAAVDPAAIEFLPAGRRGDGSILQHRAVLVADLVERRDLLGGEAAGFRQNGVDKIFAEIAERAGIERRLQASDVLQREGDLLDRCPIHAARSS